MKKLFFIAALSIVLPLFFIFTYAADEPLEEIRLFMGETKTIPVTRPNRLAIGNPNIVDVGDVTKDQITISPKSPGKTTLVYWDSLGEHSFTLRVFAEDLAEAKSRIDAIINELSLSSVYTRLIETEDKIMLMGEVKSAQDRESLNLALGSLKDKTIDLIKVRAEESTIDIDVMVLEVTRGVDKSLGFTLPTSPVVLTEPSRFPRNIKSMFDSWFRVSDWTRQDFTSSLRFLVGDGKARVLSRPNVACQSGKEAKLVIGGEVPVFTTTVASGTGTSTDIEYKEYGIILNMKPTLDERNRIKISLTIEVSELGSLITSTGGAQAYPLTKRNITTELFMDDGQVLIIGGLIKRRSDEDVRKLPWLGDIPVLGLFFRDKTWSTGGGRSSKTDTELIISLTPTIVNKTELSKKPQDLEQYESKTSSLKKEQPTKEIRAEVADPIITGKLSGDAVAYAKSIQKRILLDLTYPAEAKEAGFQGTVKLSLHLASNGDLLEVGIKEPSGYKVIDDWSVAIAKGISSYPPFPPTIEQKDIWVDVPVSYTLN